MLMTKIKKLTSISTFSWLKYIIIYHCIFEKRGNSKKVMDFTL